MFGRVTIFVDSEIVTSFQGELEQWKHKINFEIPRKPLMQIDLAALPEPQLHPIKTITLKVFAQLNGTYPQPYLYLFYYNYDNPTDKQMNLDVTMAVGKMREIL